MTERPPRIFEGLLAICCRDEVGRLVAGDLAEEFDQVHRRAGRRVARRWYRWQVMRSIAVRALAAAGRLASVAGLAGTFRSAFHAGPAVRALRRAPWYAATVILVIALTLALATTVFAVVDGLLFKPLPYADADRLVSIELGFSRDPEYLNGRISPADVEGWQAAMPDVPLTALRVEPATGFERLNESDLGLAHVRPNLLDVLGVRPFAGGFSRDDWDLLATERPSVRPVLITWDFWQQRFDGRTDVVGRTVDPVDPTKSPIRVAGVLPPGFVIPATRPAQLLMPSPAGFAPSLRQTTLLARLPDGVSREVLQTRLEAAMARWADSLADREYAATLPDRALVVPLADGLEPWEGTALRALFAGVVVLVLVACLNVSGLMTARSLDRARDIGLRRAIGARTRDVVGLLLAEHLVLFVAGAAIGAAAAVPLLRLVVALLSPTLQLLKTPAFDLRAAAFVAIAMAVSLAISSFWPIRRALEPDVQQLIVSPGGGSVSLRASGWGSRLVTTGQVAGTIVLVVAGGLFVASLLRVQANETGFETDDVVIAELRLALQLDGNPTWNRRPDNRLSVGEFLDGLRLLPAVEAAGAADVRVLINSLRYGERFDPVNPVVPQDPHHRPGTISVGDAGGLRVPVTPGFFAAAGVTVLEGRLPTDDELRIGAPVAVISHAYARQHFPGVDPIGEHLRHRPEQNLPTFEITGVVEAPRLTAWDQQVSSAVFVPYAIFGGNSDPVLFVKTAGNVDIVMAEIVRRAEAGRPYLRPFRVQTATAMLDNSIRTRRLQSWLFGSFAVAGLILASVGLLGLVAMTMARRTREIGIRMALGATRERLVSGLVREQLLPVFVGLAVGALIAAWAVGFLESYIYQLSVYDQRIWIAGIAIVSATTLTGALIPSLGASRVDPVRALRAE